MSYCDSNNAVNFPLSTHMAGMRLSGHGVVRVSIDNYREPLVNLWLIRLSELLVIGSENVS
jgi:hypothetical protein